MIHKEVLKEMKKENDYAKKMDAELKELQRIEKYWRDRQWEHNQMKMGETTK